METPPLSFPFYIYVYQVYISYLSLPPLNPSHTALFYGLPKIYTLNFHLSFTKIFRYCIFLWPLQYPYALHEPSSSSPQLILSMCYSPNCQLMSPTYFMQPLVEACLPCICYSNYFIRIFESLPPFPDNIFPKPFAACFVTASEHHILNVCHTFHPELHEDKSS